jgi:hypothetical protein
MRKLKILTIIALFSTCAVMAQQRPERPDPKEMAKKTVSEFAQKAKISTAVQDSLTAVFVTFYNEMDKNHKPGSRPEMNKDQKSGKGPDMDKMKKVETARDLKVKSLLTAEQFKTYQKFMEEQKSKRGGPGGEGQNHEQQEAK